MGSVAFDSTNAHSEKSPQARDGTIWSGTAGHAAPGTQASMHDEPIAIIGIGCRLPGDVSSATDLWDFLKDGRDARSEIPKSRFDIDAYYSPKQNRHGSLAMRHGYFIQQDLREFDNDFFGINNLEAMYMDPQQRMLLEVVYECYESAGVKLSDVAGANVGCFVGNFTVDAQVMQARDWEYPHRYSATGIGTTILSNRVSHVFDLKGPSVTLDTACSSSLYALHFACRSLAQRDCSAAIVAAANLIQTPEQFLGTAAAGVLSNSGACHTFSADADGYGRADAVGALFLKRLSDAIRDNDPIRSIVRGTSINANGRTAGITLPLASSQEAVIAQAYTHAGLQPLDTQYVECHGTGTPVGDPIEVKSVASSHAKQGWNKYNPLLIGAVKSSFGHSEAASGITSVIKTTLALEHLQIPPTTGIKQLNPKIPWEAYGIEVVRSLVPWPSLSGRQIPTAGINSFGYGGANAHCILGRGRVSASPRRRNSTDKMDRAFLIPLSAKSPEALQARVEDLTSIDFSRVDVSDLAYTLGERRTRFNHRGYLILKARTLTTDLNVEAIWPTLRESTPDQLPLVFVFTGQGSQWPQMGKELFQRSLTFHQTILHLEQYLSFMPDPPSWKLSDCISTSMDEIHDPLVSQTVCTALQIALIDLLSSWNVVPALVVGHSSGEIAAAYAAGHLSSFEALAVAYTRGQAVRESFSKGAMIAAGISSNEAEDLIMTRNLSRQVFVACINSPNNVTLSGDTHAVDSLLEWLQDRGIFARRLRTGGKAYHSGHMKPLRKAYEAYLAAAFDKEKPFDRRYVTKDPAEARRRTIMISSVTHQPISPDMSRKPSYWGTNLESPVKFSSAIEWIIKSQDSQFIEIGPHAALKLPINQVKSHLGNKNSQYLSSLLRNQDSETCILTLMGKLWTSGYPIDFSRVNFVHSSRPKSVLTNLPNYRWNHSKKLSREPRASYEIRHRQFPRDDLLGSLVPGLSGLTSTWRNLLDISQVPWLENHKLEADVVFPATGYVAIASRAAQQLTSKSHLGNHVLEIQNMHIMQAMIIPSESAIEIFTELSPKKFSDLNESKLWWQFSISTFAAGQKTKHASGEIGFVPSSEVKRPTQPAVSDRSWPQHNRTWYARLSQVGINFGPNFRCLSQVILPRMRDALTCTTSLTGLPPGVESTESNLYPFEVHPVVLDAQLQAGLIARSAGDPERLEGRVPVFFERIHIWPRFRHRSLSQCTINSSSKVVAFGTDLAQTEMLNADKSPVASFSNFKAIAFHGAFETKAVRYPLLRVHWQPDMSRLSYSNASAFVPAVERYIHEARSRQMPNLASSIATIMKTLSPGQFDFDILQLGSYDKSLTVDLVDNLDSGSPFQRFQTFAWGDFDSHGRIGWQNLKELELPEDPPSLEYADLADEPSQRFDIILCSDMVETHQNSIALAPLTKYLKAGGKLLIVGDTESMAWAESGCQVLKVTTPEDVSITLAIENRAATPPLTNGFAHNLPTLLVVGNASHPINLKLAEEMGLEAITFDNLASAEIPKQSHIIVTAELDTPILSKSSDQELSMVQKITDNASRLLWVTGGGLIDSSKPDMSVVFGLSRTVMAEQPSLEFFVVDIDNPRERCDLTVSNLLSVFETTSNDPIDYEYLQRDGVLHTSKFLVDDVANRAFNDKKAGETSKTALQDAGTVKLSIKDPGQMEGLCFIPTTHPSPIPSDHLKIQVKAAGINAKDLYTLSGKIETAENTCCCEFSGVVVDVGSEISNFAVGDRILCCAPGHFGTSECVPAWACCKMQDSESFTQMACISVVFGTAAFALEDIARLQPGESVLIHSAAGGVGMAAIQLAKEIGATIFATVGTSEKKAYLVDTFGLDPSHIFDSRNTSFLSSILRATKNRGVDVVLNSLTGDKLHASLEACAKFGRFIEIGKRDVLDAGKLNMRVFEQGITFSAFDLHELFYSPSGSHRLKFSRLVKSAVAWYRKLGVPPPTVFDSSELKSAFRSFSDGTRIGKIAVSFENPMSLIPCVPPRFATRFSANKSYLLVGCLGGLGRSIARYMLQQGARSFTFIGRTGADRAPAQALVDDLEQLGATVSIVRGDVQDYDTVESAVNTCRRQFPLGGVVQAAMALDESLFTSMTNTQWRSVLGPKIQGSWNLHKAISGETQLDFFLMTSSLSGSVLSPTEGNYCAANCFLDHFAAHRRSLGLSATSLALGQINGVGYIHEHSEIEQMLARRGITDLTEDDMLLCIDIALSTPNARTSSAQTDAHILTGLEATRMGSMWAQGYELSMEMFRADPRLQVLALGTPKHQAQLQGTSAVPLHAAQGAPAAVAEALRSKDEQALRAAVFNVLAERLSHLILVPLDKIAPQLTLAHFGIDSMLAAEYRTFIFRALGVDVPFLALMDGKSRMSDLTSVVCEALG